MFGSIQLNGELIDNVGSLVICRGWACTLDGADHTYRHR